MFSIEYQHLNSKKTLLFIKFPFGFSRSFFCVRNSSLTKNFFFRKLIFFLFRTEDPKEKHVIDLSMGIEHELLCELMCITSTHMLKPSDFVYNPDKEKRNKKFHIAAGFLFMQNR